LRNLERGKKQEGGQPVAFLFVYCQNSRSVFIVLLFHCCDVPPLFPEPSGVKLKQPTLPTAPQLSAGSGRTLLLTMFEKSKGCYGASRLDQHTEKACTGSAQQA
jgi:hypothetical protein